MVISLRLARVRLRMKMSPGMVSGGFGLVSEDVVDT